jgi:hypothetical protein
MSRTLVNTAERQYPLERCRQLPYTEMKFPISSNCFPHRHAMTQHCRVTELGFLTGAGLLCHWI